MKIAWFSDIHLGHANTPASHITHNLRLALPDNSVTAELDMIVFAGDVFDRLLTAPEEATSVAEIYVVDLLKLAKRLDIVVRIMEGTPLHDWEQSRMFTRLNEIAEIGADVKYVNKLDIEYIDRFGINILYVPDKLNTYADTTWEQVVELMAARNLDQVDFSVVHGMFPHQVPKLKDVEADCHKPDRYLSITKQFIFVGHVHQHSQCDRIIAAGSFDRLKHGEEERKGHIRTDGEIWTFIENKNAMLYITIDCARLDHNNALSRIDGRVRKLSKGSHVCIKAYRDDPAFVGIENIKQAYPGIYFKTKEVGKPEKTALIVDVPKLEDRIKIGLTRTGVTSDLLARVQNKRPDLVEYCRPILMEMMDVV